MDVRIFKLFKYLKQIIIIVCIFLYVSVLMNISIYSLNTYYWLHSAEKKTVL